MHTTIHSDGWGDYPNPKGYSTEQGFHTRFESVFVGENIERDEVLQRVPPPAPCDCDIMARVRTYLAASNAQVIPLYELEKHDAFAGPNQPGEDFVATRMAAAVGEIRDLVIMAWNASEPHGRRLPVRHAPGGGGGRGPSCVIVRTVLGCGLYRCKPDADSSELNSGEEVLGSSVVARRQTTELFDSVEEAFDQVSLAIDPG